jgi:hypothetical protein
MKPQHIREGWPKFMCSCRQAELPCDRKRGGAEDDHWYLSTVSPQPAGSLDRCRIRRSREIIGVSWRSWLEIQLLHPVGVQDLRLSLRAGVAER